MLGCGLVVEGSDRVSSDRRTARPREGKVHELLYNRMPVIVPWFNFGIFATWPNKEKKKKKRTVVCKDARKRRRKKIAVECKKKVDIRNPIPKGSGLGSDDRGVRMNWKPRPGLLSKREAKKEGMGGTP